jgi:glycogen debranching enzyme
LAASTANKTAAAHIPVISPDFSNIYIHPSHQEHIMVGVEHRHLSDAIRKGVDSPVRLFLGNRKGGYFTLASSLPSRYDGFFIFDKEQRQMYKILESAGGFSTLINRLGSAEVDGARYSLPSGTDTLIIEPKAPFELNLDVRKSYDSRQWGRHYDVAESRKKLIITYTKKTDAREDKSQDAEEFRLFIVVRHNGNHTLKGSWISSDYPADRQRASPPFERFVYNTARIAAGKIAISASRDLSQADRESERLFRKTPSAQTVLLQISPDSSINFAYTNALSSLESHLINSQLLAGLPWFFQFWARDESVSIGGLIAEKRYELAKKILFHQLDHILPDGRIPNQLPEGGIGSIDSNGWCFLRMSQLEALGQLTKLEKTFLSAKVEYLLNRFSSLFIKDELVISQPKETWMDTDPGGDAREGARIELQALQLRFYSFLSTLMHQKNFPEQEKSLREKTRAGFWDGTLLADGLGDKTIRPNIFLAYYAYPDLLTEEEWKLCFDSSLEALWLDWGGLSTIDKTNPLFQPRHTGEDNRSYHHGDSWYYLNNLAAICMHRLDKHRYSYQIEKILDASTREILWMGAIGSHAEISSAQSQESFGCLSQAWSLATYIEMIDEFCKN